MDEWIFCWKYRFVTYGSKALPHCPSISVLKAVNSQLGVIATFYNIYSQRSMFLVIGSNTITSSGLGRGGGGGGVGSHLVTKIYNYIV